MRRSRRSSQICNIAVTCSGSLRNLHAYASVVNPAGRPIEQSPDAIVRRQLLAWNAAEIR